METFVATPVQPARPHALPFRVFFEEWRLRCEPRLVEQGGVVFGMHDPTAEAVLAHLRGCIETQEAAYKTLQDANERLQDPRLGENDKLYSAKAMGKLVDACDVADQPLKQLLHAMAGSALCLSGGGIRSASFGLGILQGLANFSRSGGPGVPTVLDDLDYLSTVSGGGYIGSWLSSWVARRQDDTDARASLVAATATAQPKSWRDAWSEVITALANRAPCDRQAASEPVTGGDPEPQPVRHLRGYTSYLAPALGITLDSFTLIAIVLRNLLVNWTMLVPLLFAAIAGVRLVGMASNSLHHRVADKSWPWTLIAAAVCVLLAALSAAFALPSHVSIKRLARLRTPLLISFQVTVLATAWLLATSPDPGIGWSLLPGKPFFVRVLIGIAGYATLAISISVAHTARMAKLSTRANAVATDQQMKVQEPQNLGWRSKGVVLSLGVLAAAASGFLVSSLLLLVERRLLPLMDTHSCTAAAVCSPMRLVFGFPLMLAILLASTTLFCAMLGVFEQEEDREWWARNGGFFLAFGGFWMVAMGAVFYGQTATNKVVGLAGVALAGLISWLGFSTVTAATEASAASSKLPKVGSFLVRHHLVMPTLAIAAILMIVLGNVWLEESLRSFLLHKASLPDKVRWAGAFFAACCAVAVAVNFAVNINLFSLQGMYRMRLMRAFLGASNGKHQPDPFTDFDPKDTLLMSQLAHGPGAPLHLVNATLNLVGTRNAEWKQRRAESFTFSAVHSGGWRVGYVPASRYAGPGGASVASAMAVSGAAFNPNMGYQSSPVLSLLMTFFCLRLGVWLPNPARPTPEGLLPIGARNENFFAKNGPSFALMPLVAEAFGLTDDRYRWVEITDGGHFENLGLYEMVMRRCKSIVVVDAGADPKCQFEDLGNAIRKIRIDLGVPIRLKSHLHMRAGIHAGNSYCVVGDIDYSCVDTPLKDCDAKSLNGTIVYIKASMNGTEPADILQYAYTHPSFPHEGTANQFYSESQFESYRHLGTWVIESIVKSNGDDAATNTPLPRPLGRRRQKKPDEPKDLSMHAFCDLAHDFWQNCQKTAK